jgi:hypothetical protein
VVPKVLEYEETEEKIRLQFNTQGSLGHCTLVNLVLDQKEILQKNWFHDGKITKRKRGA